MKHWFEGLVNTARIECRYTRRHPQQWVICALLPVMWLLFVANTFGTGLMTKLPVCLVNEDGGPLARELVMVLDAVPSLGLRGFDTATEADAALSRSETYGTIVIPRDFTKDSLNGRGSTLELIINKSYYAVGTILEVDVKTALAAVMKSAGTIRMTAARGGSLKAESNNLRIASPEVNFLGCEVFVAGVGALAKRLDEMSLTNVRIVRHDAVEIVRDMIAENSLDGVHIYFPDPWRKARHHKRRLVAQPFIGLLASRIRPGGYIHCATDWENYSEQMLEVLEGEPLLENLHGAGNFSPVMGNPLCERPRTKFQARGERLGYGIWDLVYIRKQPAPSAS